MSQSILPTDVQAAMQSLVTQIHERVAKNKVTFTGVFDNDNPGTNIIYTIGLHLMGLPELIMTGTIALSAGQSIMADIIAKWENDKHASYGRYPEFLNTPSGERLPLELKIVYNQEIVKENTRMIQRAYPGASYTLVQAIWPDANGVFPTEPGYSQSPAMAQTLLVEPMN